MIWILAAAAVALQQQTDTTFAVRAGTRLDVNNYGGDVTIRTWERNAFRIVASHGSRDAIEVRLVGDQVNLRGQSRRGSDAMIDYEITVPATTPVSISGPYSDISIEGLKAEITAETVEGDISVHGGSGYASLRSTEGGITVLGVRGRVTAMTTDGDISLTDITGEVTAESTDGDIVLTGIASSSVDVSTVDGDISYLGSIENGGRYRFITHDGDVELEIPGGLNATVSVATMEGDFDPGGFPVTITAGHTGRRFSFTLGSGSARLELESFDGSIRLRRAETAVHRKD